MPRLRVALTALLAVLVAGCAPAVVGQPQAQVVATPPDMSVIVGTDGRTADQLAAATLADAEQVWRQVFKEEVGKPFLPPAGGYFSVDSAEPRSAPPPCTGQIADVAGNAFYCPSGDVLAWDRVELTRLLDEFGPAGPILSIAHEFGHVVHDRLGIDSLARRSAPERYPSILVEAMADCYAGVLLRAQHTGATRHIQLTDELRDAVLEVLADFADPPGVPASDADAHGTAFDRIASFQDGYDRGLPACTALDMAGRMFTQQVTLGASDGLRSLPVLLDPANLPADIVRHTASSTPAQPPARLPGPSTLHLRRVGDPGGCPGGGQEQGPMWFCGTDNSVIVDPTDELTAIHDRIGAGATAVLLASRYGLATLAAHGRPTIGSGIGLQALCLAGDYLAAVHTRPVDQFRLSTTDLDEAVDLLLRNDYAARDARGSGGGTVYDRIDSFRSGAMGGAKACGLGQV